MEAAGVSVEVVFVTTAVPGAAEAVIAVVFVTTAVPVAVGTGVVVVVVGATVGGDWVAAASAEASAAAGLAAAGESGGEVRMFEAMAWFCVESMIWTRAPTFTASNSVITSRERIRMHP